MKAEIKLINNQSELFEVTDIDRAARSLQAQKGAEFLQIEHDKGILVVKADSVQSIRFTK